MRDPFDALAVEGVESGTRGDIRERAVPIVAHQLVVAAATGTDHDIHVPIVVQVAPCATPALVTVGETQGLTDLGERAIPFIPHQQVHRVTTTLGHKTVHVPIVVIVHPDGTVVAAGVAETALGEGEVAVAIVHVINVGGHIVTNERVQVPVVVDVHHVGALAEHIFGA